VLRDRALARVVGGQREHEIAVVPFQQVLQVADAGIDVLRGIGQFRCGKAD
jgi:hypothetical protein